MDDLDDFPQNVVRDMAVSLDDWSFDQLPSLMTYIRNLLFSPGPSPIVIFVHCEAGVDRTGEVSGSYYIQYLGWSFQQALYYDDQVENRSIAWASQNEFQWFCYNLYYVNNYSLNCTVNS